jgi:AmmeMemoRadiSam system protein B
MQEPRYPVVAGTFYENGTHALKGHLEKLFSGTKEGDARMVVSPHAGYAYSGKTAAHAISSLKPAKKFIILGPNHTGMGMEFSVYGSGEWLTPLGKCTVDEALARRLQALDFVHDDIHAHMQEHSIEVQIPFLQHRFKNFSIVPVCIMNTTYSSGFLKMCRQLGRRIALHMKKDPEIAVIASSDFSHYLPQDVADMKDEAALEQIERLDVDGFFRKLEEVEGSVCGYGPIAVVMEAAKTLGLHAKLVHKSSSGDASGDFNAVVAYYAVAFR